MFSPFEPSTEIPQEMSAEDFANMVFDKIDINGDGKTPRL